MTQDIRPEGPSGDRLREEAAERRKATARRIAGQAGLAVARAVLVVFFLPAFVILFYAVVPPPATPLMIIRAVDGHGISKQWVPLTRISPHLQRAVIAAEDAKFCQHGGFDWAAVDTALTRRREGGRLVGASTISMQTAKNLFLWRRAYFRKAARPHNRLAGNDFEQAAHPRTLSQRRRAWPRHIRRGGGGAALFQRQCGRSFTVAGGAALLPCCRARCAGRRRRARGRGPSRCGRGR